LHSAAATAHGGVKSLKHVIRACRRRGFFLANSSLGDASPTPDHSSEKIGEQAVISKLAATHPSSFHRPKTGQAENNPKETT
jgi:hypothetical protein